MDVETLRERLDYETYPPLTVPADSVVAVLLVLVVTGLARVTPAGLEFLRAAVSIPVLLFVPGFVFVTAAFPRLHAPVEQGEAAPETDTAESRVGERVGRHRPIDWRERVALSFGMSVTLIPLMGLVVIWRTGSLSRGPALLALNAFVLLGSVVGIVRRNSLPEDQRFRIPYRRWMAAARSGVLTGESTLDVVVSGVLVFSMITAVGAMGFVLVAPLDGTSYTSATLLTESPDGDLVTSGYPTEFTRNEGKSLVLRVENEEDVETAYSVVVELQRLEREGDSMTVTEEETLLRRQSVVAAGETWTVPHTVTPTMVGEDLRLTYYVYRGDSPADASDETAYRKTYLWISVSGDE